MRNRDVIQQEIIDTIVDNDFNGIVLASVRSGKTRILLSSIIQHIHTTDPQAIIKNKTILVLYPNLDIKTSWIDECGKIGCPAEMSFCTFASIHKVVLKKFDYVVIDEAHLLGEENQLPQIKTIIENCKHVILASGTYSGNTLRSIKDVTGFDLIVDYSTEKAIEDGIICDYKVIVHRYSLDNTTKRVFGKVKKWESTDLQEVSRLTRAVDNNEGQRKMFAAVNRMHFINSTVTLVNIVNKWIAKNQNERFLLFAGSENMGKNFNIPMFNSKSKTSVNMSAFLTGRINQLCLIKKGSAGVTYPNLNKIVITSINSNGENLEQMIGRALLTDTDEAEIHIFISDQSFQINWLNTALCRVDKSKISYIYEE